jgi:hypothetical protein
LYQGDSLAILETGLFDHIDALISDPPYGIKFTFGAKDKGRNSLCARAAFTGMAGDAQPFDPAPWLQLCGYAEAPQKCPTTKPIALFGAAIRRADYHPPLLSAWIPRLRVVLLPHRKTNSGLKPRPSGRCGGRNPGLKAGVSTVTIGEGMQTPSQ